MRAARHPLPLAQPRRFSLMSWNWRLGLALAANVAVIAACSHWVLR